ncbi:MAG: SCP2 sterol-binding domain-containing protein [Pseudomonadota bacterium]
MSDVIETAVAMLNEKISGGFDGSAKFAIEDEGVIIIDGDGVRAGTDADEAEVTLSANADTFREILDGDLNPTAAFMSGSLKIDGDMGVAMKLAPALA